MQAASTFPIDRAAATKPGHVDALLSVTDILRIEAGSSLATYKTKFANLRNEEIHSEANSIPPAPIADISNTLKTLEIEIQKYDSTSDTLDGVNLHQPRTAEATADYRVYAEQNKQKTSAFRRTGSGSGSGSGSGGSGSGSGSGYISSYTYSPTTIAPTSAPTAPTSAPGCAQIVTVASLQKMGGTDGPAPEGHSVAPRGMQRGPEI